VGWAAYAGLQQARNDPRQWGQGAEGYGKRFASNAGYSAVRNALAFGLDSALGEDPRYYRSRRSGVWPRTKDVLRQLFICRKDSGGEAFAFWRFGGAYGAAFVSNTWLPKGANSAGDALVSGTLSISADAGVNLFNEFWPDIKKRLHRK